MDRQMMKRWRLVWAMSETRLAPVLAIVGLVVCSAVGSWWTADAVMNEGLGTMMVRLWLVIFATFYYLVMLRVGLGLSLQLKSRR